MNYLADAKVLLQLLDQWVERGWLRALDQSLAQWLHEQCEHHGSPASPELLLLAALASHQVGRGHVCLDLSELRRDPQGLLSLPPEHDEDEDRVTPADLLAKMETGVSTLHHPLALSAPNSPLVQEGERLYLRRYWRYEQVIRQGIASRLQRALPMAAADSAEAKALSQVLTQLFGPSTANDIHWQKVACALAARSAFSVITGGPGTGKTTTVLKLLAALQAVALSGEQPRQLRIRLAAPTGKAAARLNESIRSKVTTLDLGQLSNVEALRESIPTDVVTLHRLLGSRPDTRQLRHHEDNPLTVDVLVVDEASMVDVELMAGLIRALPPNARLILLGDKDQLASVDAGAVLGDLCQRAEQGHYHPSTLEWLDQVAGETVPSEYEDEEGRDLDQCITMLRHSYRFGHDSGIGHLARAVRRADAQALALSSDVWHQFADIQPVTSEEELMTLCVESLTDFLTPAQQPAPADPEERERWARDILERQSHFQVLAALRDGRHGVEGLNERIAQRLLRENRISATTGWYAGRPVLVTRNDYALNLMNGDIGVTLSIPDADGAPTLRVVFPTHDGSGTLKWVRPSRLQSVETVYAMTVHKSQGSEFRHTCLVLPEHSSAVLTRELIYTGITRASERLSLAIASEAVLAEGVRRRLHRASGLADLSS